MKLTKIAPLALITAALGCSESGGDPAAGGSSGTGATAGQPPATGGAGTGGLGGSGGAGTTGGGAGGASAGTTGAGTAGSGGATGGAGAGGLGGAAAGTAGSGTAGMGGMPLDPNLFIPGLDGWYWELRTQNEVDPGNKKYWLTESATDQCPQNADWAMAGLTRTQSYQATGTPGQKYTINFEIRGLMALRCYSGGTPSDMTPNPTGPNNAFYAGGMQFMDSPINTYQLAITPPVAGEAANTFFLNGIPSTSGKCDEQITYEVSYKNKFVIMGDSKLTFDIHLSDCQALQNCGPMATGACAPRTVNMMGIEVHASPYQPVADIFNDTTFYPQWMVFDIQSVVPTP